MLIKKKQVNFKLTQEETKKFMETVEKRVQEFLKLNGISQKYFADLIGISPANLTARLVKNSI